jgi:O-antigen/teichoic acid export membrane protein
VATTGQERADLSTLARGGVISLAGAIANGVFGFALIVVVTRGLRARGAGAFFEGLAVFTIASNLCELGADDGLLRTIPRFRVLGRTQDLRRTLAIGLVPVLLVGTALAALLIALASPLADLFSRGSHQAATLASYIRILAPFLPLSAASAACLSATRGFGTVVPFVVVDNFGKPGIRPVLLVAVVAAGLGATAVALAWAGPIVVGFAVAALALRRLLLRAERRDRGASGPPRPTGELAGEFWRFSAPRAVAGFFATTVFWLDTLLVGAMRSTSQAGIYTAATRYIVMGTVAIQAVLLAIAPQISALVTRGDYRRAQTLYETATAWLMAPAWPIYLTLALFAPLFLRVYGPEFVSGQHALLVLALSALVAMGVGPVSSVLLMSGHSLWNLFNGVLALGLNVGLNLLLIPHLGIVGAAVAWAVSIAANNLAALIEVRLMIGLWPVGRGWPVVAVASTACFALIGLAVRAVLGPTLPGFAVFAVLSLATYTAWLRRSRRLLQLPLLWEASLGRLRGHRTQPSM